SLFAPIHWNDQFTGQGRVDALIHAVTDPISGQPEFKQTPVAIEPYRAGWYGFVMARASLDCADLSGGPGGYWAKVRGKACWRHELAGGGPPDDFPARVRNRIASSADWMEIKDVGATRFRGALIQDGRLLAAYFLEGEAAHLPPRHWLESLFERDRLSDVERGALLLGRPSQAVPDSGPVICACFGVGQNALRQAIVAGAASVEALGLTLKAGSNCGSCIPELKTLLAQASLAPQP
ncbi:MAG: (2Fe-2S)-binding protein, partial [Thiobacillaceae bacterium]